MAVLKARFKYTTSQGSIYSVEDAQLIGASFEHMESKGIEITPENIVKQASRETSPLHKFFEWDDAKAGTNWRKQQARVLINSLRVVAEERTTGNKIPVKAAYSVEVPSAPSPTKKNIQYVSITRVQSEAALKEQVLQKAKKELFAWCEKYRNLGFSEFETVYAAADALGLE